ncbi:MAG: hypothetical protein ABSE15_01290 [Candidatus Bathyarchaeia archaeon]
MKEKVAVATVKGKAYYLIVNKLQEQGIPFVNLIPGEPVPSEVKVVITTEKERHLVIHEKILILPEEDELDALVNAVKLILQGKEKYEKVIVGVDPGGAIGLAVMADGKVIEENNCFSINELVLSLQKLVKDIDFSLTNVSVKIGNGVPIYQEIVENLDSALPPQVALEVVNEKGTNQPLKENKRSRKIRHISSAKRIAARTGYVVPRGEAVARDSRIQ